MLKGSAPREPRWHALDALRAAAMLSVLLAHSSLAYIRYDVPGLLWAVRDRSTHPVFDMLFHATRIAVPLFFTLSGFFSVLLFEAKGRAGFLLDRTRRILAPLLVATGNAHARALYAEAGFTQTATFIAAEGQPRRLTSVALTSEGAITRR